MFNLREAIVRHELRPKVVHSIPGRLRLRIPALRRLRHSSVDATQYVQDCMGSPQGIEAVAVDLRTGSVLVHYRTDRLLEADVLAYAESLLALLASHRERIQDLHREDWKRIGPKLQRFIAEATDHKLRLKDRQIPEDVWQ